MWDCISLTVAALGGPHSFGAVVLAAPPGYPCSGLTYMAHHPSMGGATTSFGSILAEDFMARGGGGKISTSCLRPQLASRLCQATLWGRFSLEYTQQTVGCLDKLEAPVFYHPKMK